MDNNYDELEQYFKSLKSDDYTHEEKIILFEKYFAFNFAKERNYEIILKFDEKRRVELSEHIQTTILEKVDYSPLLHTQVEEMVNIAIDFIETKLFAIHGIRGIAYDIHDDFYEKLKNEKYQNITLPFEAYEEINKSELDMPLCKYTLLEYAVFSYKDSLKWVVDKFLESKDFPYYKLYLKHIIDMIKEFKNNKYTTPRTITIHTVKLIDSFDNLLSNYQRTGTENQRILDNSFDVIISEISKEKNSESVVEDIRHNQGLHYSLFTDKKREIRVRNNNHYMSFLMFCTVVESKVYKKKIFKEFTENFINGYSKYFKLNQDDYFKKHKIKDYKKEIEILKKHNHIKDITKLEQTINFLSISKPQYKFIPFVELLKDEFTTQEQIINYILSSYNKRKGSKKTTNRNTIKKHLDNLKTISNEFTIIKKST